MEEREEKERTVKKRGKWVEEMKVKWKYGKCGGVQRKLRKKRGKM